MANINNKTSNVVRNRIIFDIVLLGAVFYTPWWIVALLAFTFAFLCPSYYEIIIFGILMDILYGAGTLSFGGIVGLLGAMVIFTIASWAKKAVR